MFRIEKFAEDVRQFYSSRFFLIPSHDEERARLLSFAGWAIDCFKCVSIDGDNKPCDDPFHNNGSLAFLESPCLGGRKGRDGLFPATACIKIAGIYGNITSEMLIIRLSYIFIIDQDSVNEPRTQKYVKILYLNRLSDKCIRWIRCISHGEKLRVRQRNFDDGLRDYQNVPLRWFLLWQQVRLFNSSIRTKN